MIWELNARCHSITKLFSNIQLNMLLFLPSSASVLSTRWWCVRWCVWGNFFMQLRFHWQRWPISLLLHEIVLIDNIQIAFAGGWAGALVANRVDWAAVNPILCFFVIDLIVNPQVLAWLIINLEIFCQTPLWSDLRLARKFFLRKVLIRKLLCLQGVLAATLQLVAAHIGQQIFVIGHSLC